MAQTILLVDDEPHVLDGLKRTLHKEPYTILTAHSAEQAAQVLDAHDVDLIVSDEEMPGMSGTTFLAAVAAARPDTVRIVLTGHPSLPAALRAINEGKVYQFFTKPCNEIDLAITIRRALEQKMLTENTRDLLDVPKRHAVLIDEARIVRRLRETPRKEQRTAIRNEQPMNHDELLSEIDEAVRKGKDLLASFKTVRDLGVGIENEYLS